MLLSRSNGAASVIARVKILDSAVTTGAGKTGMTSASSGLIISTIADVEAAATVYTVAGSTIESITTLGTYAAPTATKCRFKEVDATNHKGVYELHFADARFAISGAKHLLVSIAGFSGAAETDFVIDLQAAASVTHWNGTAVATPNTAGVPVVDTREYGRVNTAQAGGANSITLDASAVATTDYYCGSSVSLLSGSGAGQGGRVITAYNGSTKVATVAPAWATSPSSSSVFALVPAGMTLEGWLRVAPNALATGDVPSNTKQINSSSAAAVRQALAANEFIPGTVTYTGLTATTTQFEASDITTAAADHYVGREVYWTTGLLTGQRATISAYSLVSGRGRFTVSTLTSAPADTVTFIVV